MFIKWMSWILFIVPFIATRKNNYFTFAYDKNCVEGANLRNTLMSLKMPLI